MSGGRPRGSLTIQPVGMAGELLQAPSAGAMAVAAEAIMADRGEWQPDAFGMPEYRRSRGRIDGSVVYLPPGEERGQARAGPPADLAALCAALWDEVAALSAADLQLLLYVSNAWMSLPEATEGILLNAGAYAQARGHSRRRAMARGKAERERLNASVHRLAHLELRAVITRSVTRGTRRQLVISGRLLLAEPIGQVYTAPLPGLPGRYSADVTAWRLVPGVAWLTSRELRQIGRYPAALLELDPYRDDLAIRLGVYLGYQTAVRASYGTIDQSLSVAAILDGIREPVPNGRSGRARLKERFERALEALQDRGVLSAWQWEQEPARLGGGVRGATIRFTYHAASLDEHRLRHPRARTARRARLGPRGAKTPASRDENSRIA